MPDAHRVNNTDGALKGVHKSRGLRDEDFVLPGEPFPEWHARDYHGWEKVELREVDRLRPGRNREQR